MALYDLQGHTLFSEIFKTTKLTLLDSLLQEIDNEAFEALKYISDFILMLLC